MAKTGNDTETIHAEAVPYADRLLLDTQAAADMLSISARALLALPIPRVSPPGLRRTLWRKSDLEAWVRGL